MAKGRSIFGGAKVGKTKIRGGMLMQRKGMTFSMNKGWEKFNKATNVKRFKKKFARQRRRAMNLVAQDILQEAIDAGGFAANAPLTVMIKGGSKPLDDTGKILKNAVRTRVLNPKEMFVGVVKSHKFYRPAVAIHQGAAIRVTNKMRHMFFMLWQASTGERSPSDLTGRAKELYDRQPNGWAPLNMGTMAIKIPARPFMEKAFLSPAARKSALERFTLAVDHTIRELASGAR